MSEVMGSGGIIMDFIIVAILIFTATMGFKKGITTILFEIFCTIVAVLIGWILFRPVSNVIIEQTTIDESIASGIYNVLSANNLEEGNLIKVENTNISDELVKIINKYLAEALSKSADSVFNYVSVKLSHLVVNLIAWGLVTIVFRIGLNFCKIIIEMLAKLPVLKQIDKSGGMAFGLIKGFFIVYIVFAIFSIVSPVMEQSGILEMIQSSKLASVLYNNNLILKILSKGL